MVPIQVSSAPQIRAFPKLNPNRDQPKQVQGPAVTVFVGEFIKMKILIHIYVFPIEFQEILLKKLQTL